MVMRLQGHKAAKSQGAVKKIFTIVFAVWVVLWAVFFLRELFFKKNFQDYRILISRSLEGKRSYVAVDNFYQFVMFCKSKMPERSTYALRALEENFDWSIYKRRAIYYLYPYTESEDPEFILIYNEPNVIKDGYKLFDKLDAKRYMLKKVR